MEELKRVDHAAIRTNQAVIIALLLAAFVLNVPLLVALVALVMLAGTALGRPGFGFIYQGLLKPLGWLKPDVLLDHPEPHRFAQGFGGVVLALASVLLWSGNGIAGWALGWLVTALAALNLFGGFCLGCAVYYWLNRLGVPGFLQSPPEGTFPGRRPKRGEG